MIGNYDKKRKQRKALLKELESIKSLLDDGELIDDDYSALTETALSKSIDAESQTLGLNKQGSDEEDELIFDDSEEDNFLIDSESPSELDVDLSPSHHNIPVLQEKITDTAHSETDKKDQEQKGEHDLTQAQPGVLPGQQSLFEDEKAKQETIKENETNKATPTRPKTPPASKPKLPKTENPFLPKHIRDRLNGAVDLPAFAEPNSILQNPYVAPPVTPPMGNASATPSFGPTPTTNTIDQHKQAIIDSMVSEYMPKIEAQLRQRIRKMLDDEK